VFHFPAIVFCRAAFEFLQDLSRRLLENMADIIQPIAAERSYPADLHVGEAQRQEPVSVVVVDPSCFSLPYDYSLCQALFAAGCEVTLARSRFLYDEWELSCPFKSWDRFYEFTHTWKPERAQSRLGKLAKGAEHLVSLGRLRTELRRVKPAVIHFQWLPVPVLDRLFLPSLSRIAPLVLTLHNTNYSRFGMGTRLQQETGIGSAIRHFRSVIVHSDFSKRKIVERNWMPAERVHVVPHGPLDYYRALPGGQPVLQQENVVLFFGNIEPYKGVDLLLRAFAALPLELLNGSRLLIAGRPGRGTPELQTLANSLGIQHRVTWQLGFVAEKEVGSLFRSAALAVLPYREIDQSGVLMTAIAFDKAIIATRVGGIPETIQDKVHGLLVEPGSVPQLTDALCSLLSSAARRQEMEAAVRELRTGTLSWKHIANRTLTVYQQAMNGRLSNVAITNAPNVKCATSSAGK
jgi:glycosyltransferase involved in cell wall biosynthesis